MIDFYDHEAIILVTITEVAHGPKCDGAVMTDMLILALPALK